MMACCECGSGGGWESLLSGCWRDLLPVAKGRELCSRDPQEAKTQPKTKLKYTWGGLTPSWERSALLTLTKLT